MISEKILRDSMPKITNENIVKYLPHLQTLLPKYEINTPLRIAHFLAQVGHESLNFYYYREIASGKAYEGRKDLGNTEVGDGVRFRGRGIIQITGRANYKECSLFLFGDTRLLDFPELLELPENGVGAACWFWSKKNLNFYADKDDLLTITKRINGGTNGYRDRHTRLIMAKKALNI
jgi:putative chitinase